MCVRALVVCCHCSMSVHFQQFTLWLVFLFYLIETTFSKHNKCFRIWKYILSLFSYLFCISRAWNRFASHISLTNILTWLTLIWWWCQTKTSRIISRWQWPFENRGFLRNYIWHFLINLSCEVNALKHKNVIETTTASTRDINIFWVVYLLSALLITVICFR